MQQLKSTTVAILKRCHSGTFESLHGISNLFLKKVDLRDFAHKMCQALPRGICTQTSHLKMGRFQTGQLETPRLPCFELHRLD